MAQDMDVSKPKRKDRFDAAEEEMKKKQRHRRRKRPPPPKTPVQTKRKKVVRDAFSMPPDDHALIAKIQDRYLDQKIVATKSDVIRAGLHALMAANEKGLSRHYRSLEKVTPGRPKSDD